MKGRLRRAVEGLLHLQDSPHRIALAFGIGIWIAFSPLLGLHTVMALGVAFGFRLSRAAVLLGAYVNNPWTIAPLYLAGTALGCALLGVSTEGLASIQWNHHGATFYRELLQHLRPYLWPYVVGNTILGTVGGVAAYFALRAFLSRRRSPPAAA
ncbi:MAG: DUF2062 domain-containing protein [Vicinamibacteria bacterium]